MLVFVCLHLCLYVCVTKEVIEPARKLILVKASDCTKMLTLTSKKLIQNRGSSNQIRFDWPKRLYTIYRHFSFYKFTRVSRIQFSLRGENSLRLTFDVLVEDAEDLLNLCLAYFPTFRSFHIKMKQYKHISSSVSSWNSRLTHASVWESACDSCLSLQDVLEFIFKYSSPLLLVFKGSSLNGRYTVGDDFNIETSWYA